jgi:glycosyltransferase EpsD
MKKVIFISNHGGFSKFNAPYMSWFGERGWIVDNVSPGLEVGSVDNQYDIAITRNPWSLKNILAYRAIKRIISENKYKIIHCHTPVGGVLGRLCARAARKNGAIVIYTCHGFHFYKGSSLLSWVVYYTIEKFLSYYTDCIVTINQQDYILAKERFYAKKVFKINGVGVDLQRFKPIGVSEKTALRNKYKFEHDDFILIYVAQFIPRKNHIFLIKQVVSLTQRIANLKILLVGEVSDLSLDKKCRSTVKQYGLENIVYFMGYRTDVEKLYALSDILISVSLQEGMGLNLVEGMACGLPVVCSNIRGHVDAVNHLANGFLFPLNDPSKMNEYIYQLFNDVVLRNTISKQNIIDAHKFSVDRSVADMAVIYEQYM